VKLWTDCRRGYVNDLFSIKNMSVLLTYVMEMKLKSL